MLRVRILLGRGNAQRRNVCSPLDKRGLYSPVFNRQNPPSLVTALNSFPLVGLRKEDPKMKNIKNPNCPSWIRTNNCRNQSPVPYLLAIEHKNAYAAYSDKILSKVGRDTPMFFANADLVILPDR